MKLVRRLTGRSIGRPGDSRSADASAFGSPSAGVLPAFVIALVLGGLSGTAVADVQGWAKVHSQAGPNSGLISGVVLGDHSLSPPPALGMLTGSAAGAQVQAAASGYLAGAGNVLSIATQGSAEEISGRTEARFMGDFEVQSTELAVGDVAMIAFEIGHLVKAFLQRNNAADEGAVLVFVSAVVSVVKGNLSTLQMLDFFGDFMGAHPELRNEFNWSLQLGNQGPLPLAFESITEEIVAPVGSYVRVDFLVNTIANGKAKALITSPGVTQAGVVRAETEAGMVFGAQAVPFVEPEDANPATLALGAGDVVSLISVETGLALADLENVTEQYLADSLAAFPPLPVPEPSALVLQTSALFALGATRRRPTRGHAIDS